MPYSFLFLCTLCLTYIFYVVNSNHFAVWGRQIAQDKTLIKDFVTTYQPDYLLVELGFNDLGWFVSGPAATLASMKTFVDNARAAKPSIKILLANVPYRTAIAGREDLPIITDQYNQLLANAIPTWSTTASPIALVKFRENYSCELAACPVSLHYIWLFFLNENAYI